MGKSFDKFKQDLIDVIYDEFDLDYEVFNPTDMTLEDLVLVDHIYNISPELIQYDIRRILDVITSMNLSKLDSIRLLNDMKDYIINRDFDDITRFFNIAKDESLKYNRVVSEIE